VIHRVHNLRQGTWSSLLKTGAPGLFTVAALVGAIGLPLGDLYSTRADHAEALATRRRTEALQDDVVAFEAAGGPGRLVELERESRALLPRDLSPIRLNAALRWLAATCGMKIETLSVGEPDTTSFDVIDEAVGLRRVQLTGSCRLEALGELIDHLRGLGYPTALLEFRFERDAEVESRFDVSATLGLYELVPPPVVIEELDELPPPE